MSRKSITRSLFILVVLTTLSCSFLFPDQLKPQDVIDAFLDAGLVAEGVFEMKPDDYGLAPLADEGLRFLIPSICSDCGGKVLYYEDLEYVDKAKNYYELLGKEMAALHSWVFVRDHILVQINGDLPEETALKYQEALMKAR